MTRYPGPLRSICAALSTVYANQSPNKHPNPENATNGYDRGLKTIMEKIKPQGK